MSRRLAVWVSLSLLLASTINAEVVDPAILDACPGYDATNVTSSSTSFTAQLSLRGPGCNVFGTDLSALLLQVDYESGMFVLF